MAKPSRQTRTPLANTTFPLSVFSALSVHRLPAPEPRAAVTLYPCSRLPVHRRALCVAPRVLANSDPFC